MNLSEHEATIAADILTPDQVNSAIIVGRLTIIAIVAIIFITVCRLTAHCGRAL
jgi:hypothetical protein